MKYFLLTFLVVILLIVGTAGLRGRHTPGRPLEFFPDMVRQSKRKAQSPAKFFANGVSGQTQVVGTAPMGFDIPAHSAFSQLAVEEGGKAPGPGPVALHCWP